MSLLHVWMNAHFAPFVSCERVTCMYAFFMHEYCVRGLHVCMHSHAFTCLSSLCAEQRFSRWPCNSNTTNWRPRLMRRWEFKERKRGEGERKVVERKRRECWHLYLLPVIECSFSSKVASDQQYTFNFFFFLSFLIARLERPKVRRCALEIVELRSAAADLHYFWFLDLRGCM